MHEEGVQAGLGGGGIGFLRAPDAAPGPGQLPRPQADQRHHQHQQRRCRCRPATGSCGAAVRTAAICSASARPTIASAESRAGGARWCSGARRPSCSAVAWPESPLAAGAPRWPQVTLSPTRSARNTPSVPDRPSAPCSPMARALVAAGEIGRVDFDDRHAGEAAGGVVDAAREVQVPLRVGGVAHGLADERHVGVAVAVEAEVDLAGDVGGRGAPDCWPRCGRRGRRSPPRTPGPDGSRPCSVQRGQRAGRAIQFDRVLQHFQGLVDAAQVARHLRLIGVDQFLARAARAAWRGCRAVGRR